MSEAEQATEVFRVVGPDGVFALPLWGKLRGIYDNLTAAKRAVHHFPSGSRIQRGRVEWTEIDNG